MSSQIIRTTSHRRRSSVELISAGDTQNVTCAPIVYLEATVNGDLTGHPVEWVQISGIPTVTLEPGVPLAGTGRVKVCPGAGWLVFHDSEPANVMSGSAVGHFILNNA